MKRRCLIAIVGFFILFVCSDEGIAQEQDAVNQQSQQIISVPIDTSFFPPSDPSLEIFIKTLNLSRYEAAAGELAVCKGEKICLRHAGRIKSWFCAAEVCDGKDKSKEPGDCFGAFPKESPSDLKRNINSAICPALKTDNREARKKLLSYLTETTEDELIEYSAYILALQESPQSCEDYIRNYVGPYGPKWNFEWYRALSGCRILARVSTIEKEQRDLSIWFNVDQRSACSDILNSELKNACQSNRVKFPGSAESKSHLDQNVDTEGFIAQLGLKSYQAAKDDLSLCNQDENCLRDAEKTQSWICAAEACDRKYKETSTCYGVMSQEARLEIDRLVCSHLQSPSSETRRAVVEAFPTKISEDEFAEQMAYAFTSFTDGFKTCQNYVKNYLGDDGPKWDYKWYRVLAGCNILAGNSTPEQEEKDFRTWFQVERKVGCLNILSKQLKNACLTPGSGSPVPTYEK